MNPFLATLTLALLFAQDRYPAEDHAWLRFKVGATVTNKVVVEVGGNVIESKQKLTLKEKTGLDYVVEEVTIQNGQEQPGSLTRSSTGTFTKEETLKIAGKEYPCRISTAKGKRDESDTTTDYWMPKGNKYPLKVVYKQADSEGEIVAVALDEKMRVGTKDYSCAKLSGNVKFGPSEGVLTVWLTQEIPGAQARMELTLKNASGDVKVTVTPIDFQDGK